MLVRILSSLIGLPILAAFVALGGLPLQMMLAALAVVGMFEVYSALSSRRTLAHWFIAAGAVAYFLCLAEPARALPLVLAGCVLALAGCLVAFHATTTPQDCATAIFGFFYVAFPLSFICFTRSRPWGEAYVWLIFISAWGSDTFAFFTGRALGRHKLTPILSPNKTVEGAVGGLAGAALAGFLYAWLRFGLLAGGGFPAGPAALCTAVAAVGAVFSQVGDLAASAIKRHTGIKDFGKIIPGHGGLLDRFDSVLLTGPGVYLMLRCWLG
jgi:phosphatidate cytidylyltransferase